MIRTVPVRVEAFPAAGGLDLVTPPMQRKPGTLRGSENFDLPLSGGYRRVPGYDTYSGGLTPNEMVISAIDVIDVSFLPLFEGKLVGETSGAYGYFVGSETSGTITADLVEGATNYLGGVVGAFLPGEILLFGGFPSARYVGPLELDGSTELEQLEKQNEVRDYVRWHQRISDLVPTFYPTGVDGRYVLIRDGVKAVFRLNGETYAFFGDVNGNLQCSKVLNSYAGDTNFASYAWQLVNHPTTFPNGLSASVSLTVGSTTAEVVTHDFGSGPVALVATSTNKLLMFDGTEDDDWTLITTGATPDTPTHVTVFKDRCVVSIGHSIMLSAPGDPTDWTALNGAAEINVGDEVTGLVVVMGDSTTSSLIVFTKTAVRILYGSDETNFQLVHFSNEMGALPGSIQNLGHVIFADQGAVRLMVPSDAFGGFSASDVTKLIRPWYRNKVVTASVYVKGQGQYRIFFDDQTALYITVRDGKIVAAMPQRLKHTVTAAIAFYEDDGTEWIIAGTSSGEMLKFDVGSGFVDEAIYGYLQFSYNFCGNPLVEKSFRRSHVELVRDFGGAVEMRVGFDLGYGSTQIDTTNAESISSERFLATYDEASWDTFRYDAEDISPVSLDTAGDGKNIALRVDSRSRVTPSFRVTGGMHTYVSRRIDR